MKILNALSAVLILAVAGPSEAQEVGAESTPFDGEGVLVLPAESPTDIAKANDTPCGADTLAVLETGDGRARYAFCAFDEGINGVLEVLAPGFESASILGATQGSSTRVLLALVDDAPDYVIESLERGSRAEGRDVYRATIPEGRITAFEAGVEPAAATRGDLCANNLAWIEEYLGNSAWFYERELNCTNHHLWGRFDYCSLGTHRFHNSGGPAGWSQRTASASPQTTGGACAAYGQVRSCDGNTSFQALRRIGTSGSWGTSLNYWVQNGVMATWYMYASDDRCTKGKDKDDFRYRAESVGGARHRYGYMFVNELTDTGPCVACVSD